MNNKTNLARLVAMLLLLAASVTSYAQSDCFTYLDEGKTIINGLTNNGCAAYSLTIPKEVTAVRSEAFDYASFSASALVIEAGGNPVFATRLFGDRTNPLVNIQILGNSMKVANITSLLTSLGAKGALSTVYIEGYSGEWSDIGLTDVLTNQVRVVLPAALVTDQQFGNAKVYGRFTLAKDLVTFCGHVTFLDETGSNMLFYVADYKALDGRLHIQRVSYIAKGEGVLIHKLEDTSSYADLKRISTGKDTGTDASLYDANMLVGVTEDTPIESSDGDNTNYILKDGAFHPTTVGTVRANKAYLQLPTSVGAKELTISFDEETTGIRESNLPPGGSQPPVWRGASGYDLQGRKFTTRPSTKGLYINNGKKYMIR